MRNTLLTSLIVFAVAFMHSQNPNFVWASQVSGNGCSNIGVSIKTDALGNVYSTGTFDTITDFDPGPGTYTLASSGYTDIYISKLDASGNFVWAGQMGGTFVEYTSGIFIDNLSNVYTTGYFYSSVGDFDPGSGTYTLGMTGFGNGFISKANSAGNFVWAKGFSGGRVFSHSIFVDAFGSVITCGTFKDTVDFDPGPATFTLASVGSSFNGFISKLDASGNFIWVEQIKGTTSSSMKSIVTDGIGNFYCTGIFEGTCDFDPGAGTYNMTVGTFKDQFILKLDASGNFLWAKQIGGGLGIVDPSSIGIDASNNIFTAGSFNTTADFDPGAPVYNLVAGPSFDEYVLKLDGSGNFAWAKQIRGIGRAMDIDMSGDIYTTGTFDDTTDFDPGIGTYTLCPNGNIKTDIFISKLDNSGNFLWAKQLGDTSWDEGYGIDVDLNLNVYTTGYFRLTPDFDPGPGTYTLTGLGGKDAFVHKMCQVSCATGIEESVKENSFVIYPNPASNNLFISMEEDFNNSEIEIINYLGQSVFKDKFRGNLDISNLTDGIYTLQVISKNSIAHKQFVIVK